jgi:ketosteroid isomerase-like protein
MNRRNLFTATAGATLALVTANAVSAQIMDETSQSSFDTVIAFMGAMGGGDMVTVGDLMADDMIWHNEGDATLPWIGETKGKENIFAFLGVFSANLKTTLWENTDAFASGDTVAVFGRMKTLATKSGKETNEFTFALRAKVKDGKVVLWNWFEDSFAVSQAYHGS